MQRSNFGSLTRDELAVAASEDAIAVVPLGSTEQHGPHLPVSTDTRIITALAQRAVAAATGTVPVVLCPTVPYGFAEHHLPFGGTVSVDSETYIRLLTSIGRSLYRSRFRRVVFLNGHGGNVQPGTVAADRLVMELRLEMAVALVSYWDVAPEAMSLIQPAPGHAGAFESSLMAALGEINGDSGGVGDVATTALSQVDALAGAAKFPYLWQNSAGVTDQPARIDVALGERVLDDVTAGLARYLGEFAQWANSQLANAEEATP